MFTVLWLTETCVLIIICVNYLSKQINIDYMLFGINVNKDVNSKNYETQYSGFKLAHLHFTF